MFHGGITFSLLFWKIPFGHSTEKLEIVYVGWLALQDFFIAVYLLADRVLENCEHISKYDAHQMHDLLL